MRTGGLASPRSAGSWAEALLRAPPVGLRVGADTLTALGSPGWDGPASRCGQPQDVHLGCRRAVPGPLALHLPWVLCGRLRLERAVPSHTGR